MTIKVSVLMTVFNAENFLKYSVNSIIRQSFSDWELVIVDDCSQDNSLNIIKSFKNKKIKIYELKKHFGRTKALNYGLDKCKGKYVAILDADDISKKNRLKKQFEFLEKNKSFKMVSSWFTWFHINKNLKILGTPIINDSIFRKHLIQNIIAHSTVMFLKTFALKLGNYPNKLKYSQDYGLILKFFKFSKIKILPICLTDCIIHSNSMTFSKKYKKIVMEDFIENLNYIRKNFNLNILEKAIIFWRSTKSKLNLLLIK